MRPAPVLDALADLLAYPEAGTAARAAAAQGLLAAQAPDLASRTQPVAALLSDGGTGAAQELYTRTFDWSPERALEVGWHLYGEQYERGAFLVRLRGLLRGHGVEEGQELPDRLDTVLRLLSRLPAAEACELAARAVAPALARMRAGFAAEPQHPYLALLEAVGGALPPVPAAAPGGPA